MKKGKSEELEGKVKNLENPSFEQRHKNIDEEIKLKNN